MNNITRSSELFKQATDTISYDDKMTAVPKPYKFGFFPGGRGTSDRSEIVSDKKVMVLGQDYDTEEVFNKGEEKRGGNKTWQGLDKLLDDLEIAPANCFFTNAYMGLRKSGRNTGPNPGDEEYKKGCRAFLKHQIQVVAPKVILVLGPAPLKCLAATFPDLPAKWRSATTVTELLKSEQSMHHSLEFKGQKILIALVLHPCLNTPNRTKIFGKGNEGLEVAQLKPLLKKVFG